jgi:hypothetical protein
MSGSGRGLSDEAISLAQVLVSLLPDEPEATGLLALLLHCEARHIVRRELLICAPSIGGHAAYRRSSSVGKLTGRTDAEK